MRMLPFVLLACSLPAAANPVLIRESEPLTPEQEHKALTVRDGFKIQLFASEPMINKPINLAWDKRGRLWVSSTVEYPYAAKKDRWSDSKGSSVHGSRDAIKILEDTNGDGKADKVIDFADKLNIPTGVLPWHKPEHKDGCIAWSIPNIWYFADTDGSGTCDHREVLFGPLGYERDTHGMCSSFRLGPDGWVYATHGFNNTSKAVARDGSTVEMNSGNVFRFQPDGSRIEIWSRGQVNPFGLCFDRRGNLYSADCHSSPIYQLLRGAFYPSFGKPHDGIGFGPAMIEHTHGSTGICGITYLDRGVWGTEWNDHMLIGNPVTSRVNHDRIEFSGSTPKAKEEADFITSKDPWFRPVDLCLGGDGALYVADFYNRIIGHYEVPLEHPGRDRKRGRIWRIVKEKGSAAPEPMEIPTLSQNPIDDLKSKSAFVRRAAASHFQQAPNLAALRPLLQLHEETPSDDSHLKHVALMAIREHLKLPGAFDDPSATKLIPNRLLLAASSPDSAAFLMNRLEDPLQRSDKIPILKHIAHHGSAEIVTSAIAFARNEQGGDLLARSERLHALVLGLEERGQLKPHPDLVDWGQKLARRILQESGDPSWRPRPHPSDPTAPSPWNIQRRSCRDGKSVEVISSLPYTGKRTEALTGILRSKPFAAPAKLSFWLCGHRGDPKQAAHDKNLVRLIHVQTGKELHRAFPPRNDIAQEITWDLSAAAGQEVQLEVVDGDQANAYAWLAITRIEPAVAKVSSFDNANARAKALPQLAALLKVTAPIDLRDQLRPYLPPSPAPAPIAVSAEERARLDHLVTARVAAFAGAKPEAVLGAALFAKHCASCHQISGKGALLGPQLDGIGARGVERLCQDILDPNRNVDSHFHITTLLLKDKSLITGFVRGESGAVILLIDAAGKEHRLQKSTIASKKSLPLSFMPPVFEKVLTESEFNDLLSWLLQQKAN